MSNYTIEEVRSELVATLKAYFRQQEVDEATLLNDDEYLVFRFDEKSKKLRVVFANSKNDEDEHAVVFTFKLEQVKKASLEEVESLIDEE